MEKSNIIEQYWGMISDIDYIGVLLFAPGFCAICYFIYVTLRNDNNE